ncbi:hypothetical protein NM208_g15883 [Fusarium decemcellulare]|uniref:Uncharacterized protein n=1 Tax=Fusarium decemcellulare TaxID=57161 RepID=A0ACC1RF55_9HYPO|nr:hypothetical protein NM208_g15883 [Fusarium decemcellulare]
MEAGMVWMVPAVALLMKMEGSFGVALAGNPLWGEVLLNDSDVCLELEHPGEYVTLKPAELYSCTAGQMANISAPPPIRVGYLQELPAFQHLAQEATILIVYPSWKSWAGIFDCGYYTIFLVVFWAKYGCMYAIGRHPTDDDERSSRESTEDIEGTQVAVAA